MTSLVPSREFDLLAPRRRRPRPKALVALSALVLAALSLPLIFLLLEASDAGTSKVWHLIWRGLTATLLWNTVRLTVAVTLLCAIIGTLLAYCVERTDLPGRHVWAVLVVIPFAIPDFVVSFGWNSLFSWVSGFHGAVIVMTLAVYPLVYLPVAASFRGADTGQEEIARSLGASRLSVFVRITLGQARRSILAGCLLVSMVILAEYGAFEILGYRTFTTEIYSEFSVGFDPASACALSLVIVLLSVAVMLGEGALGGARHVSRSGRGVAPVRRRVTLGPWTAPVLALFSALVLAALGVPVGSAIYWMFEGGPALIGGASLLSSALYTALYGAAAALLATLMALPVALLVLRRPSKWARLLSRSTFLLLAMPGLVVALALTYFSEQHADSFGYQSAPMLIVAYALMFFPLALVGVRASLSQAPVALEEVAGSLGVTRFEVLRRVTMPLVGPGLAAAFCLVFLSCVTELTATLVLIPTGTTTLAWQFWAYETNLSYGQAAPFALAIIVIAAVPAYLLGRFFDRLPQRATHAPVPSLAV
ncbi:MAG TPA: iron ABC transporter permease [Acidimicrobiales bacterium]|jgi:iron(III) transport system permease protein